MKTLLNAIKTKTDGKTAPEVFPGDTLILPMTFDKKTPVLPKSLSQAGKKSVETFLKASGYDPKKDGAVWTHLPGFQATWVVLVQITEVDEKRCEDPARNAFGELGKASLARRVSTVGIAASLEGMTPEALGRGLEGFLLGAYRFDRHVSKDKTLQPPKEVSVLTGGKNDKLYSDVLKRVRTVVEGVYLCRDLVNEPANILNPASFTKIAKDVAKSPKISLKVFSEAELKKRKMNLILAVGQGSVIAPRMLHFVYKPTGKAKKKIGLVGKGVTFDSGGLSLKPPMAMYGMKGDMGGAALMMSTLHTAAKLGLKVHIEAFIPLVENLPSGAAIKPGDVVKGYNGKTVEIENTDAEGRLILADALSYACEQKLDVIFDAATLTGACVVALGDEMAALYGDDDGWTGSLLDAANVEAEKLWRMPLERAYTKLLKSNVADINNTGGRAAGSITAALFLSEFVEEKQDWCHLDIAGPADAPAEGPYFQKGGSGYGVRTLLRFLEAQA